MEILRQVNSVSLNIGDGMAKGLFNLSNSDTNEISFWFDTETKDEFMEMDDEDFLESAEDEFMVSKD